MKAMIVGAGIGGLTAAIALRRAGVETTVFERAGELREVGAGLLLAANAVRALDELGLSEKVRRLGTPASAARILSWCGETLTDVPADEPARELHFVSAARRSTQGGSGPDPAPAIRAGDALQRKVRCSMTVAEVRLMHPEASRRLLVAEQGPKGMEE
jgi:glycine/D-amino acid oxidase-like deaminating enzyme